MADPRCVFNSTREFERSRMTQTYEVLALDPEWEPASDELPRILYSGAIENMEEAKHPERGDRFFLELFPGEDGVDVEMAIDDAIWLCDQAATLENRAQKIDCFKAAEILLLHAAKEGSATAYENLGILYASNVCEGDFLRHSKCGALDENEPYPHEERSAHCFQMAIELAQAGEQE